MAYGTGEFRDVTETKTPGLYFQLTPGNQIDTVLPYGGVAIPVSLISCSPEVSASQKDSAIPVTASTYGAVMSLYTFASENTVRNMTADALKNASYVYLCPFDGVKQDDIKAGTKHHLFGKGAKASVEMYIDSDADFELLNGTRVRLTYKDDTHVNVQFDSPDGAACLKTPLSVEIKDGTGTVQIPTVDGEGGTTVYKTTPSTTYAKVNVTVNVHTSFKENDKDEIRIIGGLNDYTLLINSANSKVKDGSINAGCYAACDMLIKKTSGSPNTYTLRRTTANWRFAYLKNTVGYHGLHSGYYLKIDYTYAELHYIDASANMYPPMDRVVKSFTYANTGTLTVASVLENQLKDFIVLDKAGSADFSKNAWDCKLLKDSPVYIGFSPIFERIEEKDRFEKFMDVTNKTRATILYYPHWSDQLKDGNLWPIIRAKYQEIQQWYLDSRAAKCPYTQLLMDECLMKEARKWLSQQDRFSRNDPFLISLRSGNGNKTASQQNGAFTAGVLASCGSDKSAFSYPYGGSAGIKLYSQSEIEQMFYKGILVYHDQDGTTQIYADTSAYLRSEDTAKKHNESYERNRTVRTVNEILYRINQIWYQYYQKYDNIDGSLEQMLHHDVIAILESMSKKKAIVYPNPDDVKVTSVTERKYMMELYLHFIGDPEVLFVRIGV